MVSKPTKSKVCPERSDQKDKGLHQLYQVRSRYKSIMYLHPFDYQDFLDLFY